MPATLPPRWQDVAKDLVGKAAQLADADRAKLAAIVRKQWPTKTDTTDPADVQLLTSAAENALQPELLDLLIKTRVPDVATSLVCEFVVDEAELAERLLDDSLKDKIPDGAARKLKNKLETLGELIKRGADLTGAFADIARKYPNIRLLQAADWKTFKDLGPRDLKILRQLWNPGNPLEAAMNKYGLSDESVQALNDAGVTEMDDLTEDKVKKAVEATTDHAAKSKLTDLFRNESPEGQKQKEAADAKKAELAENTAKAAEMIKTLRADVDAFGASNVKDVRDRLAAVTSKLDVDWKIKESDLTDPSQLLSSMENEITNAANIAADGIGNYESDEQIVARVSGGAALYGINMLDEDKLHHRAPRPILQTPVHCPLMGPTLPFAAVQFKFASSAASNVFVASMNSSGVSTAAAFHADGWGASVDVKAAYSEETESARQARNTTDTSEVSQVHTLVVPTGSFRLSTDQLLLSDEAKLDLANVKNNDDAKKFVKNYGSHVTIGVHHVGGLFSRIITMSSFKAQKSYEMHAALSSQVSASADAGYHGWGVSVGVSASHSESNAQANANGSQDFKSTSTYSVTVSAEGPNTLDPTLFIKLLEANNRTWRLIDRGGEDTMLPIWEIPEVYNSHKDAAKSLSEAYGDLQKKMIDGRKRGRDFVIILPDPSVIEPPTGLVPTGLGPIIIATQ